MYILAPIVIGSALSISTSEHNKYFHTNTKEGLIEVIVEVIVGLLTPCWRVATSVQSFECLASKCITAIPLSKSYRLCALPIVLLPIVFMIIGGVMNKDYALNLGISLFALFDYASTISSIALLILVRSAVVSNPILFTASVILTVVDVVGKINNLLKICCDKHWISEKNAQMFCMKKPEWVQNVHELVFC